MNRVQLPPPLTEQAEDIDEVWNIFLTGAFVTFAFVVVLGVYVLLRFRRRDDRLPRQVRENIPVEIAYTVVPLLVVIALFVITFTTVRALDDVEDAGEVDLVVGVVGFQWQWRFVYPESGIIVTGTEEATPELVLPASSTIRFDLSSVDVIHSFWIPGFRFKRDMFPNEEQSFAVDVAEATGTYAAGGVCSEFCGLDHHKMFFDLRVVTPAEFEQWLTDNAGSSE